jgi:antitoxin component HigA of HigAB toxin-antitoxin module
MARNKPFAALRGAMITLGLENTDIARIIGKSATHVSRCFNGHADWTLSDEWAIMAALRRPDSELHVIFPKGGKQREAI